MATSNGIFYSQTDGLKLSTNNFNRVIISTGGTTTFTGNTSGSTVVSVRGTNGPLMSVIDTTTGPIFSVNDNLSNTVLQVNSNYSTIIGTPLSNTFVVSGTNVGIGGITSPSNKLHVSASTDPVRFVGLQNTTGTRFIVSDSNGVLSFRTDVLTGSTLNAATGGSYSLGTITLSGTGSLGTITGLTHNAATGGSFSNGVITLSGTGTLGTITGLTTSAATIYNSNSNLTSNRVVGLSSFTLNFSSSTNPNTLVLSGGNVGIGNSTPTEKLDVIGNSNFTLGTSGFIKLVDSAGVFPTHFQASYGNGHLANNCVFNGVNWVYSKDGGASMLQMEPTLGQFAFYTSVAGTSGTTVPFIHTMRLVSGNTGINVIFPTNKLHVSDSFDPVKLEGIQTSTDSELLTIDGSGVVHKIQKSSVGAFLRNETNSGVTDTITINQSIFNPSDLRVLSTSVFIIDTNADYYVLGDLYNSGTTIVNGTLKVGGIIYNSGTITGSGIIE